MTLNVALGYGGRAEIGRAVRELAVKGTDLTHVAERQLGARLAPGVSRILNL